ncbi:MAG: hypothetical protein M3428_02045 [Pseudomonadota bacterium]|nr:hypothetical protein [Pseudomonadota bacterium]
MFILILVVVAALIAIGTGFVDINQTRPAQVPAVDATRGGVTASGGQAPAFDVETGSVAVGTTRANVVVPTVQVRPPGEQANAQANVATNIAQ